MKRLTSKQAIKKATRIYETATGKKVGSGSVVNRTGAYLFFGAIVFLFVLQVIRLLM